MITRSQLMAAKEAEGEVTIIHTPPQRKPIPHWISRIRSPHLSVNIEMRVMLSLLQVLDMLKYEIKMFVLKPPMTG